MNRPSIRYFLSMTAFLAICFGAIRVASWQSHGSVAGNVGGTPNLLFDLQRLLHTSPFLVLVYACIVGVVIHIVTTLWGLTGLAKWAFAILAPTVSLVAVGTLLEQSSPPSARAYATGPSWLDSGLVVFTIGFTVVNTVASYPYWIRGGATNVSILRGVSFAIAYPLYLATFFGVQMATGMLRFTSGSFVIGIPILFIAAFTVAGVLQMRGRPSSTPIPKAMAWTLVPSVVGTLVMFVPWLVASGLPMLLALCVGMLITLSLALAGLSTFGLAAAARVQFPSYFQNAETPSSWVG